MTLTKARSRRHRMEVVCDTDFADDLALLSNTVEDAQLFLLRLEAVAVQVGLYVNNDKTKYMA